MKAYDWLRLQIRRETPVNQPEPRLNQAEILICEYLDRLNDRLNKAEAKINQLDTESHSE